MQAGGGGGGPGNPSKPSAYNDDDTETVYSPNSRYTASQPGSPLASELKNGAPISQADALGAAEGLVRRMPDGALHGITLHWHWPRTMVCARAAPSSRRSRLVGVCPRPLPK